MIEFPKKLTFLIGANCICQNNFAIHLHVVPWYWTFLIARHKLLVIPGVPLPVTVVNNNSTLQIQYKLYGHKLLK